jgi:CRISPR-associated protein Cmr5
MTRDQERAKSAFTRVTAFLDNHQDDQYKKDRDKYGSMAHKIPVLIRTAGLVAALAFVEAKGDKNQRQLLDDIASTAGYHDRAAFLTASREANLETYMYLTQEVLAVCLWYKRFGASVLNADVTGGGD